MRFFVGISVVAIMFCISGTAGATEKSLSEHHSLSILPHLKKEVGQDVVDGITSFFRDAEAAIESRDIDGLMLLYSDGYRNGTHRKEDARKIWERIFSRFGEMASIHNMRIETYSAKTKVIIVKCTGLLLGQPSGASDLITIDTWTNSDHVIINEDGVWRLLGTAGKAQNRFWFDKPMQPLF